MSALIDKSSAVLYVIVLVIIGLVGCEFYPSQSKDEVPSDHTEMKGYAYHKPGMFLPQTHCAECHSSNGNSELKGGISTEGNQTAFSCYQCHTDFWSDIEHTFLQSGPNGEHYHKEGLYEPTENCTECHGENLEGGSYKSTSAPSCSKCHGPTWDWKLTHTELKTGDYPQGFHDPTGLYTPETYCSRCHGNDLKGGLSNGKATKSCYECHTEEIWDWQKTHTMSLIGVHGTGLHDTAGMYDPKNNCSSCHGNDLKGGSATKSCYECHTRGIWDWRETHTSLKTGFDPQGYHDPVGINDPKTYCVSCHGSDLRGGTFNGSPTKSCYECHNHDIWDWRKTHTVRKDGKYHHPDLERNPHMCQDCHGFRGQGGSARSCYGSGCHSGVWPPRDD